jgi:hypothetical protein
MVEKLVVEKLALEKMSVRKVSKGSFRVICLL